MSATRILGVVPDHRPVELLVLRNAHGWSPSIWTRLLGQHWFTSDRELDRLWQSIEDQPAWRQVPNLLTFDTGVLPYEAFEWAADQLDEFERRLPAPDGHVNHVPAVAQFLRTKPETPLLGVWGTSVSENPFDPWDMEQDCPGTGIPLDEMYLLPQHRSIVVPNVTYLPGDA